LATTALARYDDEGQDLRARNLVGEQIMQKTSWMLVLGAGALTWCFTATSSGQSPGGSVDVKVVKYDELGDIVRNNKGKVVLLDFWALTCPPCKEAFPHTVEMQKTYGDKGLVVVSVSTDSLEDQPEKTKQNVLKFLRSKNATFTNVILDEPTAVIENKLRIGNLPCIYVFDREGKWRQFIGEGLKADKNHRYVAVEEYVKSALQQPGPK
jgi:thiol-disulfide isomerase/thioredoxin